MSHEDSGRLSRRQVLTGIGSVGAVGAVGALGGASTLGQFVDRETVSGQLRAGMLDLEICWEEGDEECNPLSNNVVSVPISVSEVGDSGSARIRYELPDNGQNNPGYVWFRTGCPVDACGLERALNVTLWEDVDCDGTQDGEELLLTQGPLCDVLGSLHDGVLLDTDYDSAGADPLEPGETRCFGIEWELVDPLCEPDEVEVLFEFRAEQARHSPDPVSPWAGATCVVDCDDTSDCMECLELAGISFVAFCGPNGVEESDLTLWPTAMNLDREPVAFEWESTAQVDSVIVKLGNAKGNDLRATGGEYAMYEFDAPAYISATANGGTRGHVRADEGTLVIGGEPWNPCPDGTGLKWEIDEEAFERV